MTLFCQTFDYITILDMSSMKLRISDGPVMSVVYLKLHVLFTLINQLE